jgi:hypothetical protein
VQLAPQHDVASRTHRSTINWIFTMFSLIIDYWIDSGIYSAFIMFIINLIIDKSRLCYKITIKYWQKYCILNYTRIKPRSRPPQKKIHIFYAPRFFSGQNKKKSAHITRANTVLWNEITLNLCHFHILLHFIFKFCQCKPLVFDHLQYSDLQRCGFILCCFIHL